jgi:hypothetical protein
MAEDTIALYAVRNKEGQWFRRKGYGGYGKTWVDDFSKARIYTKIGPARGVITFFSNTYPKFGSPDLVKLVVGNIVVIDEAERIQLQKKKKAEATAKAEVTRQRRLLKETEQAAAQAQARLEALRKRG